MHIGTLAIWLSFVFSVQSVSAESIRVLSSLSDTRLLNVRVLAYQVDADVGSDRAGRILRQIVDKVLRDEEPLAIYAYLYPAHSKPNTIPFSGEGSAFDAVSWFVNDPSAKGWLWYLKYTRRGTEYTFIDCTRWKPKCNKHQR